MYLRVILPSLKIEKITGSLNKENYIEGINFSELDSKNILINDLDFIFSKNITIKETFNPYYKNNKKSKILKINMNILGKQKVICLNFKYWNGFNHDDKNNVITDYPVAIYMNKQDSFYKNLKGTENININICSWVNIFSLRNNFCTIDFGKEKIECNNINNKYEIFYLCKSGKVTKQLVKFNYNPKAFYFGSYMYFSECYNYLPLICVVEDKIFFPLIYITKDDFKCLKNKTYNDLKKNRGYSKFKNLISFIVNFHNKEIIELLEIFRKLSDDVIKKEISSIIDDFKDDRTEKFESNFTRLVTILFKIFSEFSKKMEVNNYKFYLNNVTDQQLYSRKLQLQEAFYIKKEQKLKEIKFIISPKLQCINKYINQIDNLKITTSSLDYKNDHKIFLLQEGKIPIPQKSIDKKKINYTKNVTNIEDIDNLNLNFDLIDIEPISPNEISIISLLHFYSKCTLAARTFPLFISKIFKDKELRHLTEDLKEENIKGITKAEKSLDRLIGYYKQIKNDASLISIRTTEFIEAFESMISKLKLIGEDFSKYDLNNIEVGIKNTNQFIQFPAKKGFKEIINNKWKTRNLEGEKLIKQKELLRSNTQINFYSSKEKLNEDFDFDLNKSTISNTNNINSNNIHKNENFKFLKPEENSELLFKKVIIHSQRGEKLKTNKVNKNKEKKIFGFYSTENQVIEENVSRILFEESMDNFNEKEAISEEIKKMKNIDVNNQIKFEENIKSYIPLYFNEKVINTENENNLNKLINESCFLATYLYSAISEKSKTNNIPYDNIEVNILIDCTRIISDQTKYYNMLIVCGLSIALHSIEIPFSLSLVGDKDFKILIKKINDQFDEKYLQQILDCIFIQRYKTKYASCLNYAINFYKTKDISTSRVFILISGGIDSELRLVNSWRVNIFNNIKNSFGFIFTISKTISNNNLYYLKNEVWKQFNEGNYISKVKVAPISQNVYDKDSLNSIINMFTQILTRNEENLHLDANYNKADDNIIQFNLYGLNIINSYIYSDELKKCKDFFVSQQKLPPMNIQKIEAPEIKLYSNIQGKIIKSDIKDEEKQKIYEFVKDFKISKEKLNTSTLETIFKPNLPTQYILTSRGSKIDIHQLILYFLNPTPNPLIYREIEGGLIKNYGLTLILDNSISCLSQIQSLHTIQTLRILLSTIATLDIPCFDFIVTGDPNPKILCSERNPIDALKERSELWFSIFASISSPNTKADLLSAIKIALDLNSLRKLDYKNYIFVLTDGLYSQKQQKEIIEIVNYCESKEIDVFGIGIGVNPCGITKLFSKCVYSPNPYNLFQAINKFFVEANHDKESIMPKLLQEPKFTINNDLIQSLKKNPVFKKLKTELNDLQVTLESLYFYNPEQLIENSELGKIIPVRVNNMYSENLLKGQKILIVMLWTNELNTNEKDFVNEKYIFEPYTKDSCVKKSLDFYGIEIKVVKNYEDAILELCKEDEEYFNCCPYYACWVMCGPPYAVLPDKNGNPNLVGQFIDVLNLFWENGGSVVLLAENEPFTYQANLFLKKIKFEENEGKIDFIIGGNHKGGHILIGNEKGDLSINGTFNKKINIFNKYQRASIAHNLKEIYEGITVSYACKKIENKFIPVSENEVSPFVPFSKDSEGGINSLFYCGKNGKGDIVIDCSYTKFLTQMTSEGTARYIQNIGCWTANSEYHYNQGKKPNEFRPKKLPNFNIDKNTKWEGFLHLFVEKNPKTLKTLFAFDFSGSVSSNRFYHSKLIQILLEYYKESRGDKIYIWNNKFSDVSLISVKNKLVTHRGMGGGTDSSLIAKICELETNSKFEHLVITTDGKVPLKCIDESDVLMRKNNIHFDFVTTFIIGRNGNLSVGAPYCRNSPNTTFYCTPYIEKSLSSLTVEEIKTREKIDKIHSVEEFNKIFEKMKNYIRAQTLGTSGSNEIKAKLYILKANIKKSIKQEELKLFENKWEELYEMSQGSLRNKLDITVAE